MIRKFTLPINGFLFLLILPLVLTSSAFSQSLTAGTISGTVTDPNNAVLPNASVTIENAVTAFKQTVNTGADGAFRFNNVPFNNYVLTASADGFSPAKQTLNVRISVPININIPVNIGSAAETVTVTGAGSDMLENVPSTHTDVDKNLLERLPVRSPGNGLSDVVTLAAPGVVADSNGFMHPLGDHAQVNVSLDNQPISDQQSKAFSTQIPVNAIQSLEVVTGAAPAEYGDKTSLVINAITHSGLIRRSPQAASMHSMERSVRPTKTRLWRMETRREETSSLSTLSAPVAFLMPRNLPCYMIGAQR
jgi:hypothetical protein